LWLIKIEKEIDKLIEKKNKLGAKWLIFKDLKISFEMNIFIKNYLRSIKAENEKYLIMTDNLFINKNQYNNYLDNYYYKIYEFVLNDNIEWIRELTYEYERNIYKVFINRKYLYNFMIFSPKHIYSDIKIIKSFNNKISLLNN